MNLIDKILFEYEQSVSLEKAIASLSKILDYPTDGTFKNCEFVFEDEENPGNNIINVCFISLNYDKVNTFITKAKLLGWFPSLIADENGARKKFDIRNIKKEENKDWFNIIFEKIRGSVAKPKITLFHVTPIERLDKIRKVGLTPRTNNKKSSHPERIYFSTSLSDARRIAPQLYAFENNKENLSGTYVLLLVLLENLPSPIEFFNDPNFNRGVYTTDNIPAKYIRIIEEIKVKKFEEF